MPRSLPWVRGLTALALGLVLALPAHAGTTGKLTGKVTDENSPYLARELRCLGVEVRRVVTIPDELPVIVREMREMAREYDLVFTTGGVGPTHDDMTIAAVAQAFERRLVRHPLLEGVLRRHYGARITAAQITSTSATP